MDIIWVDTLTELLYNELVTQDERRVRLVDRLIMLDLTRLILVFNTLWQNDWNIIAYKWQIFVL